MVPVARRAELLVVANAQASQAKAASATTTNQPVAKFSTPANAVRSEPTQPRPPDLSPNRPLLHRRCRQVPSPRRETNAPRRQVQGLRRPSKTNGNDPSVAQKEVAAIDHVTQRNLKAARAVEATVGVTAVVTVRPRAALNLGPIARPKHSRVIPEQTGPQTLRETNPGIRVQISAEASAQISAQPGCLNVIPARKTPSGNLAPSRSPRSRNRARTTPTKATRAVPTAALPTTFQPFSSGQSAP